MSPIDKQTGNTPKMRQLQQRKGKRIKFQPKKFQDHIMDAMSATT